MVPVDTQLNAIKGDGVIHVTEYYSILLMLSNVIEYLLLILRITGQSTKSINPLPNQHEIQRAILRPSKRSRASPAERVLLVGSRTTEALIG